MSQCYSIIMTNTTKNSGCYDDGNLYAQHFLVRAEVFGSKKNLLEVEFSDGTYFTVSRDCRGKLRVQDGTFEEYMVCEALREASTLI